MRSSEHQAFYLSSIKRPILPSIRVDPVAFQKYGLYPCNLLANLGWSSLVLKQSYTFYPAAVREFYINLRLEGRLQEGRLSSIVDGYRIVVTPQLLTTVLGLPSSGRPIFDESDLNRIRFFPSSVLGRWTNTTPGATDLAVISDLPDYLKTDFSCLMLASLVKYSDPKLKGGIPFGPAISYLLEALGIPLRDKYKSEAPLDVLRPRHILREIGWKPSQPVYASGGEVQSCHDLNASDDEIEDLAKEMNRSLQIQEALDAAANESFSDGDTEDVSDEIVEVPYVVSVVP
ncbi:hypothetical protein LINGRAPRIM_LOCUS2842 [Linum grandiflorum]